MRLSQHDLLKIAEEYMDFFQGSSVLDAIKLQATKANLTLKYFNWTGSDLAVINRVIIAANGNGKLKDLLEVFAQDGFHASVFESSSAQSQELPELNIIGCIPLIPTFPNSITPKIRLIDGWVDNKSDQIIRAFLHVIINTQTLKSRLELLPRQQT